MVSLILSCPSAVSIAVDTGVEKFVLLWMLLFPQLLALPASVRMWGHVIWYSFVKERVAILPL